MSGSDLITRTGVLLIGHGTRDPEGLAEFAQLAEQVARRLDGIQVASAFLEFAEPPIGEGVLRLVAAGVEQIVFVPVLLFAAGHAKRDIPLAVKMAEQQYPQIRFAIAQPLGCHDLLLRRSAELWKASWRSQDAESESAHWILAGRGSLDAEATAETGRYASLLSIRVGQPRYSVAFLSMAQPRLNVVLSEVLEQTPGPVLVLPHLLFQGDLLREFHSRIAESRRKYPKTEIHTAGHLGPSPLVADAMADQVLRFMGAGAVAARP